MDAYGAVDGISRNSDFFTLLVTNVDCAAQVILERLTELEQMQT